MRVLLRRHDSIVSGLVLHQHTILITGTDQMIVQAYTAPVDGKSWKTQESHTQIGSNRDLQHLLESSSASSFPKKSKETKYIVWVLGATVCAVGGPVAMGKFSGCASL